MLAARQRRKPEHSIGALTQGGHIGQFAADIARSEVKLTWRTSAGTCSERSVCQEAFSAIRLFAGAIDGQLARADKLLRRKGPRSIGHGANFVCRLCLNRHLLRDGVLLE